MSESPDDVRRRAERLKDDWERRAQSGSRDFFVASHPGWNDPARWEETAEADVERFLYQVDQEAMKGWEVLEIGCGVGRLARPFARRARGYTGFDIAPGMVDEARRRCTDLENARFFVADGLSVPEEARDRRYEFVLSLAVFIHCPIEVTRSLVASAYGLVAPGGQLRFQLRADHEDPTGVESLELADAVHEQIREVEEELVQPEHLDLLDIEGRDYMGHAFGYDEARAFLEEVTGGDVTLMRVDLANIYGWVVRPR